MAAAIKQESIILEVPAIKFPEIKSLSPLMKETPGKRGIIEPSIKDFQLAKRLCFTNKLPKTAIKTELINVAKKGI